MINLFNMINIFNIPNYTIDTSQFNNLLHGDIVEEFTENFCRYVGGKYGCAVNSATSAIFLLSYYNNFKFKIPTMLPPVVLNAIINGNSEYEFVDDPYWIGHSYGMHVSDDFTIVDSAQEVIKRNFYGKGVAIYSFYPTKPVSSCDGGMIVSNDKGIIDFFKMVVMNGTQSSINSWDRTTVTPGWKMYMNSVQAYMANESLKNLEQKRRSLRIIRDYYNNKLNYANTSNHLYTIKVRNNVKFIEHMKSHGIQCGIHYKCLHKQPPYNTYKYNLSLPISEELENQIVSIPFHEELTCEDMERVIQCVKSGMKA